MKNHPSHSTLRRAGFFRWLGIGVSAFWLMQLVVSCASAADVSPQPLTFVISWDDPKHANLKVIGGYTVQQGVLIVHAKDDTYVAVSSTCPFDNTLLAYQLNSNQFYCAGDGSAFDLRGAVVRGPATKPLTVHTVIANKTIGQFTITL